VTIDRRQQLATALAEVSVRIERACQSAGRSSAGVELLPVAKGFPALDVALLTDLGLRAFGENRVQEAGPKIAEVAELRPELELRWHLVGRLQRNKARAAAVWAARIESIDATALAHTVDAAVRRAVERGERSGPLPVLVQVSLDADPNRGGAAVAELPALADTVAASDGLRLDGVMAVAPMDADPDRAFGLLAEAAARLRSAHPEADVVSAGMSGDLEAAIRHGSTCVRVGTALFGPRRLISGRAAADQGA
jgi:PLP dependent protein